MKVAFIYPSQNASSGTKPLRYHQEMAFGISYISSILKRNGHNTSLFVLVKETCTMEFSSFMDKFCPDVMCISTYASNFPFVARWVNKIKELYPEVYLVGGGYHISLNPTDGLKASFDAICIGEGEYPMLELVQLLEEKKAPSGIANLWIKHNGDIERNPPRPFMNNLDDFPIPDREMWEEWILHPNSPPSILLGRGCPFQCTYCSNHALSKVTTGRYVRLRSEDNILQELKEVVEKNSYVDEVYFEVETFGVNIPWSISLCQKVEEFNKSQETALSFSVNLRITPNRNFEQLFEAMRRSNFKLINIGLESGSERIRRDILKRNYSNQDIINAVTLAKHYNIQVHLLNMIGLPGETVDDFKETIYCNRICQPDLWPSRSIFFPYPGTELHKMCQERNFLPEYIDTERERTESIINLPGFSKKQIQHYFTWFDYYVYKGHRPLFKLLLRGFAAKIHSSYRLMRIYLTITEYGVFKSIKEFLWK